MNQKLIHVTNTMKQKLTDVINISKPKVAKIIDILKISVRSVSAKGKDCLAKAKHLTIQIGRLAVQLAGKLQKSGTELVSDIRNKNITVTDRRIIGLGSSIVAFTVVIALTISIATSGKPVVPSELEPIRTAEVIPTEFYAISINGTEVLNVASEEDVNSVLAGITANYQTQGSEITNIKFVETVEIIKKEFAADEESADQTTPAAIMSVPDALTYVMTGTMEPKTYVVQGGDTLWDIAVANGISPYELQAMNPGFDPKRLSIGQELYLYETHPFVTVQLTEIVTAQERIPYGTTYENTDALYRGQTQVKSVGSYGSKEIKSEIVKENGVIVSSTVLSETITQEPVTQIALQGTQTIPTHAGTGSLMSPVAHIEVSSAYGSRGGGRHAGVDLRNPKGTPIVAADEGVVTFAAYSGSFGNTVKISHGNGLETLYAHCDTMIVSVGDIVSKGQQIATVGISGNATGYHLHFEVRVNGAVQNPMNYI